jgi:DNA-binding NarL/FixJ family response regulator
MSEAANAAVKMAAKSALPAVFVLTADAAVFAHWRQLAPAHRVERLADVGALDALTGGIVVVDTGLPARPGWSDPSWGRWSACLTLVAASTQPDEEEGLAALNAGLAGYCHALAAGDILRQVVDVVASGELWVGRALMKRLLNAVNTRFPAAPAWSAALTEREAQVARSAAEGASNAAIGERLGITERTVKAHLTAIFEKLRVSDRVQLALKVHGLR